MVCAAAPYTDNITTDVWVELTTVYTIVGGWWSPIPTHSFNSHTKKMKWHLMEHNILCKDEDYYHCIVSEGYWLVGL